MLDVSLLRQAPFLLTCLGYSLSMLGYFVPIVYILDEAVQHVSPLTMRMKVGRVYTRLTDEVTVRRQVHKECGFINRRCVRNLLVRACMA